MFLNLMDKSALPSAFIKGGNVIKGPDDFVNSIGKSTFLMIVDFVFGCKCQQIFVEDNEY